MTGLSPEADDAGQRERDIYVAFHARRFDILVKTCRRLMPARATAVLDVGRSPVSYRLADAYDAVWTLGYPEGDPHAGGLAGHISFDLNQTFGGQAPPTDLRFDLIVFAETLEHLVAPPERVLQALAALLRPGGLILCQTPNAAALANRIKLLFGRNPFERLRDRPGNFGHIRESTGRELAAFAQMAGLQVLERSYHEYFGWPPGGLRRAGEFALRAASALVPSFRRGQMAVLRKVWRGGGLRMPHGPC